MDKQIYFIVRSFEENKGSYAGVIEEFSKSCYDKKYKIKILSAKLSKNQKTKEKTKHIEIIRFPILNLKIPILGMNTDYIFLSYQIKKYFKKNPIKKGAILVANGRAALGILDKEYFLRMGQPANVFLKNMEIANEEVSFFTKIARKIHFWFQSYLEKKVVKNASAFIVSSEESREKIISAYHTEKKPYFIPFSGVKSTKKTQNKKTNKKRNILFVSAGKEKVRKGVVYLEKILPRLFDKYENVNLVHVGSKFEWNIPAKYKSKIIKKGRVAWREMKGYFTSSEFIIFSSLQEGFPNVLLEAMEAACPILSSDIEGIREYIIHKKTGYIYKRGDLQGLLKGARYMLDNPKKVESFGKKAQENIQKIIYSKFSKELLDFLNNKKTRNLLK